MPFSFQARKVHLTYKTHLPMEETISFLKTFADPVLWSIVHEIGDVDEDEPTPYAHTHVFFWWQKKVRSDEASVFDVKVGDDTIHPHIKTCKSIPWAELMCMKYHLGHKTKADAKKYYIKPVKLEQFNVEDWKFSEETCNEAACEIAGIKIKPKSLARLRNQGFARGFDAIEGDCDKEFIPCGVEWDKTKKSLVIVGTPDRGKTNWALSQFTKPFVVRDTKDLKQIPKGCDGLVFDDQKYAKLNRPTQMHVADVRCGSSISCGKSVAWKPMLPAIFTTNNLDTLFDFKAYGGNMDARTVIWPTGEKYLYRREVFP